MGKLRYGRSPPRFCGSLASESCHLLSCLLSLALSSFSTWISGLVPKKLLHSWWCPLGHAIPGPAAPEQPRLAESRCACRWCGGAGEGDGWRSSPCVMVCKGRRRSRPRSRQNWHTGLSLWSRHASFWVPLARGCGACCSPHLFCCPVSWGRCW